MDSIKHYDLLFMMIFFSLFFGINVGINMSSKSKLDKYNGVHFTIINSNDTIFLDEPIIKNKLHLEGQKTNTVLNLDNVVWYKLGSKIENE